MCAYFEGEATKLGEVKSLAKFIYQDGNGASGFEGFLAPEILLSVTMLILVRVLQQRESSLNRRHARKYN